MWVADMDFATPAVVIDALMRRLQHPILGYEQIPITAREAHCRWITEHHRWEVDPAWVLFSPSVVASVEVAIGALKDVGDEVIVMDPIYPPLSTVVRRAQRHLIRVESYDPSVLERVHSTRTRAVILCSPHNPTGVVWREEELRALGEWCVSHDLFLISDEIHADLVYPPLRHFPIASLSPQIAQRTLTMMGPGKSFNLSGMALSSVIIPDEAIRSRFVAQMPHWGELSILSHVAWEAAYTHAQGWHQALIAYLADNAQLLRARLSPLRIGVGVMEGSYLAWLDCRALGMSDRALRRFFADECGVGLSAGSAFGPRGSGHMRLNYALPRARLEQALRQIEQGVSRWISSKTLPN